MGLAWGWCNTLAPKQVCCKCVTLLPSVNWRLCCTTFLLCYNLQFAVLFALWCVKQNTAHHPQFQIQGFFNIFYLPAPGLIATQASITYPHPLDIWKKYLLSTQAVEGGVAPPGQNFLAFFALICKKILHFCQFAQWHLVAQEPPKHLLSMLGGVDSMTVINYQPHPPP